jgi:uncharacterized protein YbbC (DUF1343 family)
MSDRGSIVPIQPFLENTWFPAQTRILLLYSPNLPGAKSAVFYPNRNVVKLAKAHMHIEVYATSTPEK